MLTIKDNSVYTYDIKKSKFITLLFRVYDINEINKHLEDIKKEYKDATHYCYAYKVNNLKKASDDGEPSGTAGAPILEVLDKKDLNNVLCVVVRYFGGIKLGAGGLLRAYSTSVREAIDHNEIVNLIESYIVKISTNYDNKKRIEYHFKDNIVEAEYTNNIIYILNIKKEDIHLVEKYDYEIIKESFIEE